MDTPEACWTIGPSTAPLSPLVKGLPLLGSALTFGRDPIRSMLQWHHEHGPIFRMRMANRTITVLGGVEASKFASTTRYDALSNHATFIDLIRDLGTEKNLAVLDGEEHAKFRKAAQPSYSRAAMGTFIPVVHQSLADYVATLADGQKFEVFPTFQRLISLQLGQGVANLKVDSSLDALQQYMRYLMFRYLVGVWPSWTARLPSVRRAKAESHKVADDVMRFHQETPPGAARPEGLIDRLLAAHREDPSTFPLDAVRAAAFGPFLAGQDTVAGTTAFMLAAIHLHPDVKARVQAEVDELYANGVPEAAAFKYATTLIKTARETMRLYPVAPIVPKRAACEFEFCGYRVPAGEEIYLFQTRLHFEPDFHEDPWTFNIDRPAGRAVAFSPFGLGPHMCIGAGMGELQVITNVASLMSMAEFELAPKSYVLRNRMIPLSPHSFYLRLTGRRQLAGVA